MTHIIQRSQTQFSLLVAAALLIISSPASGALVSINFDTLSGMGNSPGSSVPQISQLSDQLQPLTGASFNSLVNYVAVVAQLPGNTQSPPNSIGGVTASGNLSYGSPIDITFSNPSNASSPAVTSFVAIRGDTFALPGATATMDAFDLSGTQIGTVTASDIAGGLTLSLTLPGIHRVHLTQVSGSAPYDGTIGFDNLSFESVTVPEPITLAIMCVAGALVLPSNFCRRARAAGSRR